MKFVTNGSIVGVDNLVENEFNGVFDNTTHYDRVLAGQWEDRFGVILQQWYEDIPGPSTGQNSTGGYGPNNIWYRRSVVKAIYTADEIGAGLTSGLIYGLRFNSVQEPQNQPLPNYTVGLASTSLENNQNPGNNFTVVYGPNDENFSSNTVKEFIFETPFAWSGPNLGVAWAWGQVQPTYNRSGTVDINNSGRQFYSRSDSSGTYTVNSTASSSQNFRPVIQLLVGP